MLASGKAPRVASFLPSSMANQIIFNRKSIINLLNLNGCTNHGQCDGKKLRLKEASERGEKFVMDRRVDGSDGRRGSRSCD